MLIVAATTRVRGDEPADLSIAIEASGETVVTGSTVTYTVIVDNDGPVDAHHVQLRAERAGNLSGRVYTVRITATDSANQSGSAWTTVKVPHDRGH